MDSKVNKVNQNKSEKLEAPPANNSEDYSLEDVRQTWNENHKIILDFKTKAERDLVFFNNN